MQVVFARVSARHRLLPGDPAAVCGALTMATELVTSLEFHLARVSSPKGVREQLDYANPKGREEISRTRDRTLLRGWGEAKNEEGRIIAASLNLHNCFVQKNSIFSPSYFFRSTAEYICEFILVVSFRGERECVCVISRPCSSEEKVNIWVYWRMSARGLKAGSLWKQGFGWRLVVT